MRINMRKQKIKTVCAGLENNKNVRAWANKPLVTHRLLIFFALQKALYI